MEYGALLVRPACVCGRLAMVCLAGMAISALAASTTEPRTSPWSFTPANISVTREIDFEGAGGDAESEAKDLFLTLRVKGPDFRQIVAFGKVKYDQVTDDLGEDLNPDDAEKKAAKASPFKIVIIAPHDDDIHEVSTFDETDQGFTTDLTLVTPGRSARKLVRLKGQMTLRDRGTEKTVLIPNLPALNGKDIADPAFAAAGITAHATLASAGALGLKLHFSGKLMALGDIQLLDSSGANVISGQNGWSMSMLGEKDVSYDLTSPLSPSMKLKVEVFVGQKDRIVPFDLHDIPLP